MFDNRINDIMEAVNNASYGLKQIREDVKAEYLEARNINRRQYANVQMLERQYDFYDGAKEISDALDEAYDRYNETDRKEDELFDLIEWLDKTINTLDFI